jgi:hypothetical protein
MKGRPKNYGAVAAGHNVTAKAIEEITMKACNVHDGIITVLFCLRSRPGLNN